MERKSLLVFWDPTTGAVEIDRGSCSAFDAAGILAVALHQAGHAIPDPACGCTIDVDE